VVTLPDAAITVARTDAAQTFTGVQTFNNNIASAGISAAGTNISGFNRNVVDKTASSYNLDLPDFFGFFTNAGAGAGVTFNLRTLNQGANYGFIDNNSGANRLTVKPASGDSIIWTDGTAVSSTGSIVSTARYNSFTGVAVDADHFVVLSATGTWTVTP
jgi:hypothetical protein